MNYVNFNNFQPLNETVYTREEAKTAILMVETKNVAKANILVANLSESGNDMKTILSLVENKLDMVSALKSAKELLERNAFLGALAKAREAKAKTFEFNGKEYEVFGATDVSEEESVEEKFKFTEDQVNMTYGFYGSLETVYKESQVQKMFTDAVNDLMKAFKISEDVALLVLNAPIGRHTADMLYSKFAATASEGVLKYFGGSEAKAKNFINQMQKANEAMNPDVEINEADEKELFAKAQQFKMELMKLKKSGGSEAAIAAKEEQLKRTAKALMIARSNAYEGLDFENVTEALTSKNPNEVETIELDMAWDELSKEDDKAAKAAFKKYKIKVKGANGQPGTYEVTGKKKDILAYIQSEFYEMEADEIEEYYPELLEASNNYGGPYGLSKAETKKVAETLAKAISKNDGVKCTVNVKTLEEDSFDLDIDGEEYDGGSYNIYDDGSVRNMAVRGEKYGTVKSTVEDFIKGLKKPVKESVANEATIQEIDKKVQKFVIKNANDYDYSNQDSAFQIYLSLKKLYPTLIKESTVNEAGDHEVGMANGQLLDIAKNASELMKKIGETEKDIPGWIQDHISQSQNFLNQANTGYHELEESTELDEAKKYDLGFGSLGNGTTVWNRAKEVRGDYETVAHISVGGNITYYDKKMPEDVKRQIEDMAANESNNTNEAMFKAKDYDKTLVTYALDTKADEIYIIKVDKVIKSSFPDVSKVPDKRFHGMFGMMLEENWMKQYDKLPEPGDILPAPKKDKAFESKITESAMSDIDIIAQEAKDFKSFVKEFKKEYKNMDSGNQKELEAWLQTIYDSAKENMDESLVRESQSADIAAALKDIKEFNRGNIKIEDLTKSIAKNLGYKTSKENLEAIEDHLVASRDDNENLPEDKTVVRELYDLLESLVTEKDEAVFIEFLNKDKNFKKDTKHFKSYDEAVKWAKANFDKFSPDMIKYESLEINEKNEVTVSLRYAVQANDIFDDMYRRIGKKEATDVFSFKTKAEANDFIESLIMVGVPENEINENKN